MTLLLESTFIGKKSEYKRILDIKRLKIWNRCKSHKYIYCHVQYSKYFGPQPTWLEDDHDANSTLGCLFVLDVFCVGVHFQILLIDLYIPDCVNSWAHKYHRSIISGSLDNFKGQWVGLLAAEIIALPKE